MGATPTTTNQPVQFTDAVLHGLIFDVGVNALKIYAKAQVPILGAPPLSWIFDWLVDWITGMLYVQLERFVSFAIIDFQTQSEKNSYMDAVQALSAAHKSGDLNAIEKAKEDFKTKLGNLIHYDGS